MYVPWANVYVFPASPRVSESLEEPRTSINVAGDVAGHDPDEEGRNSTQVQRSASAAGLEAPHRLEAPVRQFSTFPLGEWLDEGALWRTNGAELARVVVRSVPFCARETFLMRSLVRRVDSCYGGCWLRRSGQTSGCLRRRGANSE
jgi:hypothetical protein